jgi:hypothetical protein
VRTINRFSSYAVMVILVNSIAGCGVLGFDHSTRVARKLVYQTNGVPNYAAVTAALNARFPSGSKLSDLKSFVRSLGGDCGRTGVCNIPLSGVICAYSGIWVSVVTSSDGSIQHIEASRDNRTC